jgi:hypothetical protein
MTCVLLHLILVFKYDMFIVYCGNWLQCLNMTLLLLHLILVFKYDMFTVAMDSSV